MELEFAACGPQIAFRYYQREMAGAESGAAEVMKQEKRAAKLRVPMADDGNEYVLM